MRPPFFIYVFIHSCFFFHIVNFFPPFLSFFLFCLSFFLSFFLFSFLSFFIRIWLVISIASSSCLIPCLFLFVFTMSPLSYFSVTSSSSFIPSFFLFFIVSHLLEPAPQSDVTMVTKKQLTSGGSMVPMSIAVRVLYTVERITQLFTVRNRRWFIAMESKSDKIQARNVWRRISHNEIP